MTSGDSSLVLTVDDDTRMQAPMQRLKAAGLHESFIAQRDFCHTNR